MGANHVPSQHALRQPLSSRLSRRGALALAAGAAASIASRLELAPRRSGAPRVGTALAAPGAETVVCNGFNAEAIEAAVAAAGPFGDVFLPEGTYAIDRLLHIPHDGLSLRGAGNGTVLQAQDESFNVLYMNELVNVRIRDLRIVGVGRDGPGGIGILADSCQGCTFEGLSLQACGSADASGIHLRGTRFSRISQCTFVANGRGIHLYNGADNNIIEACGGQDNAKEMIFLTERCTDCTISNCTSDGDGSTGAAVSIAVHKSDRSVLSGSTIVRSRREQGVEIAAGDDNIVANCTIADNNWAGLHIVNAQRTVVVGNVITGNRQAGILLRSAGDPSENRPSDGCVIAGNIIADNNPASRSFQEANWSGIEIERGSHVRIERNVLRDNHAAAIHIRPGNRGTQIRGNLIAGTHTTILVDEGAETASDLALT